MARLPDDGLDRLLTRALREGHDGSGVCPDADDLAAFLSGDLGPVERDRVERHVSACARCAQVLAQAIESAPSESVAGSGAGSAWWWRWRWVVPAAAAATVVGVWVAVSPEIQRPPERTVALSESREIPPRLEPQASAGDSAPLTSAPAAGPPGRAAAATIPPPRPAEDARAAATAAPRRADQGSAAGNAESGVADPARDRFAAAPPPVPSPPPAPLLPPAAAPAAVQEPAATASAATTARADEPAVLDRPAGGGGRGGRGGGVGGGVARAAPPPAGAVAQERAGATAVLTRSPDGRTLWRSAGNTIERSLDGGASWAADYTFDRPITAGSAISADVAWFASAGGLVLRRTADGWSVAQPPAPGVEIAAIAATSPTAARVTLADGRQLLTEDGGLSWK